MKGFIAATATAFFLALSFYTAAAAPQDEKIGGTVIGRINENGYKRFNEHAMVSISRFPKNITEFKQLEAEVGGTPQGAATLMVVAITLLRDDEDLGTECIAAITSGAKGTSASLKKSIAAHEYYPRLFYKGASAANSYQPFSPFRVDVFADKESYSKNGQLTLYLRPGGGDKNAPITVKKIGSTYKVTDFSGLAL